MLLPKLTSEGATKDIAFTKLKCKLQNVYGPKMCAQRFFARQGTFAMNGGRFYTHIT
jgi:hypothetical protein